MCSWCWGYRPTWLLLRAALANDLTVTNVLGGLAPDNDQPMPMPLRQAIRGHWQTIQNRLGTEFNFDFWEQCQPRRDTYKACRAVLAAANQGQEEAMIEAIQRGYYLRALNPSEPGVLVQLATELGLDHERFGKDLLSKATEQTFQQQLVLRDRLGANSFPTLVLSHQGRHERVRLDYLDYKATLSHLENLTA